MVSTRFKASLIFLPNSSGEMVTGFDPSASMILYTAGSLMMRLTSLFSASMMGLGAPARVTQPIQLT